MQPKLLKAPKFSLPRLALRRPSPLVLRKITLAGLLAMAVVGAFCWGRFGGPNQARGQAPQGSRLDPTLLQQAARGDHGGHVVAYIYGDQPITREDLGEYLVQRLGADWIEFLVNHTIIERKCADKNIRISDAEVSGELADELKNVFHCSERDFVATILQPRNKTLFEYREDVIRPKLALQRYIQDKIKIGEEDIQKGFEAKYGPMVECRLIAITKDLEKNKYEIWGRANKGPDEFEREAKQWNPPGNLRAEGGKIPPIHKHFADPNLEREAFKLKPGETSTLVAMGDGTSAILHCVKLIPPDGTKKIDQERMALNRELFEARVAQSLPVLITEMRKEANPQIFLKRDYVAPSAPALSQMPAAPQPQPQTTVEQPAVPPSAPQEAVPPPKQ
jgi:PPIC-type PPIASE domain